MRTLIRVSGSSMLRWESLVAVMVTVRFAMEAVDVRMVAGAVNMD